MSITVAEGEIVRIVKNRTLHILKTWPEPFEALLRGHKTHEFRREDDRPAPFEVGDTLYLREYDPEVSIGGEVPGEYTGRDAYRLVTYVSRGPDWGIPKGYVVMSVGPTKEPTR